MTSSNTSIQQKLAFPIAILFLIYTFLIYSLALKPAIHESKIQIERALKSACHHLTLNSNFIENTSHYEKHFERVDPHSSDMRLTIISNDGRPLYDTSESPFRMDNLLNRPEVEAAIEKNPKIHIRKSTTTRQKMFFYALKGNTPTSPIFRVSLPYEEFTKFEQDSKKRFLKLILISASILILICSILFKSITKPLVDLHQKALKLSKGKLDVPFEKQSTSEIQAISDALNKTQTNMKDKIQSFSEQTQELETLLSSMTEGVIAVDNEGFILNINTTTISMLDLPEECEKGKPFLETIRIPVLHSLIFDTLSLKKSKEIEFQYGPFPFRIIHSHSSLWKDKKGETKGVILVLEDITEIRSLEQMRKDFVANVSHELRTPATSIKGYAETLLEEESITDPNNKKFLKIISKQTNQLIEILNDLLTLSRIEKEEKKTETALESSSLNSIIEFAIQTCQPLANAKQITLVFDEAPEMVGQFHCALLEQAILNLLTNAIKYSPENSTVFTRLKEESKTWSIEIEDQGVGIKQEHLPRLFERFYRVEKSRSRQFGGTGLGLSIVKHTAKLHGGDVSVVSHFGKGSVFSLKIPKKNT